MCTQKVIRERSSRTAAERSANHFNDVKYLCLKVQDQNLVLTVFDVPSSLDNCMSNEAIFAGKLTFAECVASALPLAHSKSRI